MLNCNNPPSQNLSDFWLSRQSILNDIETLSRNIYGLSDLQSEVRDFILKVNTVLSHNITIDNSCWDVNKINYLLNLATNNFNVALILTKVKNFFSIYDLRSFILLRQVILSYQQTNELKPMIHRAWFPSATIKNININ